MRKRTSRLTAERAKRMAKIAHAYIQCHNRWRKGNLSLRLRGAGPGQSPTDYIIDDLRAIESQEFKNVDGGEVTRAIAHIRYLQKTKMRTGFGWLDSLPDLPQFSPRHKTSAPRLARKAATPAKTEYVPTIEDELVRQKVTVSFQVGLHELEALVSVFRKNDIRGALEINLNKGAVHEQGS